MSAALSAPARNVPPRAHSKPALPRSPTRMALARFLRHRLALAGLAMLLVIAILSFAAPLIAPSDPFKVDLASSANRPRPAIRSARTPPAGTCSADCCTRARCR